MPSSKQVKSARLTVLTRSFWFNKLLRQTYRSLPLPWHIKQWLKKIYLCQRGAWKINQKDIFELYTNQGALSRMVANARQFDPTEPWVLVINVRTPTPDQDVGSVRMLAILRVLREMGFRITFISDSENYLPHYQEILEKDGDR